MRQQEHVSLWCCKAFISLFRVVYETETLRYVLIIKNLCKSAHNFVVLEQKWM